MLNAITSKFEITQEAVLSQFNGIDIEQMQHYIKLHCKTYLKRVLKSHGWGKESLTPPKEPMVLTMIDKLQTKLGPEDMAEADQVAKEAGFSYHEVLGETIYASVICHFDTTMAILGQVCRSSLEVSLQGSQVPLEVFPGNTRLRPHLLENHAYC